MHKDQKRPRGFGRGRRPAGAPLAGDVEGAAFEHAAQPFCARAVRTHTAAATPADAGLGAVLGAEQCGVVVAVVRQEGEPFGRARGARRTPGVCKLECDEHLHQPHDTGDV